jgi:hypothetical protein
MRTSISDIVGRRSGANGTNRQNRRECECPTTIAGKRRRGSRPAVSSSSNLLIGMAALRSRTTTISGAVCVVLAWTFSPHVRAAETAVKIVVLGDSLTAGYGVPDVDAFPAKLEYALRMRGRSVVVANAGVSGDTASMGLARLNRSIPADTDAVILELGANDMLRGFEPSESRSPAN